MNKPRYEPPTLIRHRMGMMNKFARAGAASPVTEIDGVPVDDLVERYGSPLFVFSERALVQRFRELRDAFSVRYPRVRIAWSYKTNYLDAVCRVFHREGAWAEVVSYFEWQKARHLGIAGDHIHFNGPLKPEAVLEEVLPLGTTIHIDHFDEMAAAERVAMRHGIRPKVALRINLGTDRTPAWSRFGFHLESGQARDAARRLVAGDRLELVGIHCHIGTFVRDPEAYGQSAEKLARFANDLQREHGVRLSFIDVGGGFASHNTLRAMYLPGDQEATPLARYAEAIVDGLSALDCPPRDMPTLVLETGRALVDDAGYLISTVIANKRLTDGTRGVVLDVGVNTLFTAFWYKHRVVPAQAFGGMPETTILYGPLCMNIDVVREAMLLPPLRVGDRLVFHNVGAYNVTQWMQFITYRPAVVLVAPDGEHAPMRRAEELATILDREEVPPWLQEQ